MTNKQRLRGSADKLWYIALLKDRCEVCNKPAQQVHHFFPKGQYGHLRYLEANGISLCMGCHFSHHHKGDPLIHDTIKEKRGKKWFDNLKKEALKRPANYLTTDFYKQVISTLEGGI